MDNGQRQTAGRDRLLLEQLASELATWRNTEKTPGKKIPEELWTRATALGRRIGVWSVCKFLRLEYNHLKRRCDAAGVSRSGESARSLLAVAPTKPRTSTPAAFVELVPVKSERITRCSVDVESRGVRVHLVVEDAGPLQLAVLIKHVLG